MGCVNKSTVLFGTSVAAFINDGMTQITLPVPLGTTVYQTSTDCCDACTFNKELTAKNKDVIRCDSSASCHTKDCHPIPHVLNFDNIRRVLEGWGSAYFDSEAEAAARTADVVAAHVAEMCELGFDLHDDGTLVNLQADTTIADQSDPVQLAVAKFHSAMRDEEL